MNIEGLIGTAIGCSTLGAVGWKLLGAWTAKAVAEARAAEQFAELRASHAKFMERMEAAEVRLREMDVRRDERHRIMSRPHGVPIQDDET